MSLAFPASPNVGQTYQNWVWTGSSWDQQPGTIVNSWNGRSGVVTMNSTDIGNAGGALKVGNRVLIGSYKPTNGMGWIPITDSPNFFADWDIVEVEWYGLKVNADCSLGMQVSHDSSTWETGGAYYTAYKSQGSDNIDYSWGGQGTLIWMGGLSVGGAQIGCGIGRLYGAPATDRAKHWIYKTSSNSGSVVRYLSGYGQDWNANNNQAVKAMRLWLTAGTFAAGGVVNWYGIGNGPNRV